LRSSIPCGYASVPIGIPEAVFPSTYSGRLPLRRLASGCLHKTFPTIEGAAKPVNYTET
jgi:hypothetical protein